MAKSYACGAAVEVVGKAMQLHGGIGYTWESGVHVYLKRADAQPLAVRVAGDAPPPPRRPLPAEQTSGVGAVDCLHS